MTLRLRSLRARLLAVYSIAMLGSALAVATLVTLLAGPFNRYMLQYTVEDFAEGLASRMRFDPAGRPNGFDEEKVGMWLFHSFKEDAFVRVTSTDGKVTYSPTGDVNALAPAGKDFEPQKKRFALVHNGVSMHAATIPVRQGDTTWYVQLAVSDRLVLRMRHSFGVPGLQQGILATCLAFLAVVLVATHFTLSRMLAPLREASIEAQAISPQRLDARLQARAMPDELAPLVDAFNGALDRLQAGFRTQQEFLANAAHELKTPLALIRAQIEMAPPEQLNPELLQDVDQMARQIQQLLLLAEASEPQNYRIEKVLVVTSLNEVCEYMVRIAAPRGVRIIQMSATDDLVKPGSAPGHAPANAQPTISNPAPLYWQADRGGLFTLLKNLLENAVQHSHPGGTVTLLYSAEGFSVVDQGTGVAPEHLNHIFERFWRGPSRRDKGAGLGLSICQEIAQAHQWHIAAHAAHPGLEVRIRFQPIDGCKEPANAAATD